MAKKYKCQICKDKINWNNSYGYEEFLICSKCTNSLLQEFGWQGFMPVIFKIGQIRQACNQIKSNEFPTPHCEPDFYEELLQEQKEQM